MTKRDSTHEMKWERNVWRKRYFAKAVNAQKQRDALLAENKKIREVLRINLLRWNPRLSHTEIDELIDKAVATCGCSVDRTPERKERP